MGLFSEKDIRLKKYRRIEIVSNPLDEVSSDANTLLVSVVTRSRKYRKPITNIYIIHSHLQSTTV